MTDASGHFAINYKAKSNSDAEMENWQRRKARSARKKNNEKWPQALKRKEMHIKVPSEENSGEQCLGITVFTSNLPKGMKHLVVYSDG